jgi:hypothetical protein
MTNAQKNKITLENLTREKLLELKYFSQMESFSMVRVLD